MGTLKGDPDEMSVYNYLPAVSARQPEPSQGVNGSASVSNAVSEQTASAGRLR